MFVDILYPKNQNMNICNKTVFSYSYIYTCPANCVTNQMFCGFMTAFVHSVSEDQDLCVCIKVIKAHQSNDEGNKNNSLCFPNMFYDIQKCRT